jgi:O-acetyl-ADP-ribose deacetylase (regulator of RNase III)
MKIIYRLGNLLDHPGRFILHGCNAQGVQKSGVAKAIRDLFPECYDVYKKYYETHGLNVGQVVVADCTRFVFFNGITQEFYGSDGKKYLDDLAVVRVMKTCNNLLSEEHEHTTIKYDPRGDRVLEVPELAMPLIGAGLAGGDWSLISQTIEEESTNFQPVVYIMDAVQFEKISSQTA